jgi:hypothetical protein
LTRRIRKNRQVWEKTLMRRILVLVYLHPPPMPANDPSVPAKAPMAKDGSAGLDEEDGAGSGGGCGV